MQGWVGWVAPITTLVECRSTQYVKSKEFCLRSKRDLTSTYEYLWAPQVVPVVRNLPTNAGDTGSTPGSGRSPRGGHGNPLQDSCLENPMDRGAWQATVQGVAKSQTLSSHTYTHAYRYRQTHRCTCMGIQTHTHHIL